MSADDKDEELRKAVVAGMRSVREDARHRPAERSRPPDAPSPTGPSKPLPPIETDAPEPLPRSPDREELNAIWNVSEALEEPPGGRWGRLLSSLRRPWQRMVRFALGPFVERQARMNSAQVRFDNEIVTYIDGRLDRISGHYDQVLGAHGRRMEEIDERHRILQQELIRHVHDLVARIEFVFESAEQNHLYLEGMLRETREELKDLLERWEGLGRERNAHKP